MLNEKVFKDRSIVVYLSYAPAGFGHLRVADALYHGLPEYVTPVLLGTHDYSITFLHRISSIHRVFRAIFVWTQNGMPERVFTSLYRKYLHRTAGNVRDQIITSVNQRIDPVKTIVIIATHFGIAHQVSIVKKGVEKELGIKIFLMVQVTDDSPQLLWYVHHADLIFVPSEQTAEALSAYAGKNRTAQLVVTPYPLSPYMGRKLKEHEFHDKINQVDPSHNREIHMMIPLSGAAVGTDTLRSLMQELHEKNKRFKFHVVVQSAPYTALFLQKVKKLSYVKLYTSIHDKVVIDAYEQAYMNEVISLEVTKPSEQAFKALYYPYQRGGSILLFTPAVGRQEFDNLDFLRRHHLIPSAAETAALWEMSQEENPEASGIKGAFDHMYNKWRGIVLPEESAKAAHFITWCINEKVFLKMMKHEKPEQLAPHYPHEISPDGVKDFWEKVSSYVETKINT